LILAIQIDSRFEPCWLPNNRAAGLWSLFALQLACISLLLLHVGMVFSEEMGWAVIDLGCVFSMGNHSHTFEFVLLVALMLGLLFTVLALREFLYAERRTDDILRVSQGSFVELLEEYFDEWSLTPSEREVALLAIKGFMIADIAKLRVTKEGTIKAHCNAIYRKASVSGRTQLLSRFIDDLIAHGMLCPEASRRVLCGVTVDQKA
jgi:DNA-binding CsgD family transcriptional regulator